nr:AbfB domain-containing protein [Streptomyces dysideae]
MSASSTTAEKQASTFTVVPGLADSNAFSFRDSAGKYLRHRDFRGRFDTNNGSSIFAKDATFIARTGTASGAIRFESYNYPGYYLRHYNYQLRVDPSDGTDLFAQDSSFVPVTAWAVATGLALVPRVTLRRSAIRRAATSTRRRRRNSGKNAAVLSDSLANGAAVVKKDSFGRAGPAVDVPGAVLVGRNV